MNLEPVFLLWGESSVVMRGHPESPPRQKPGVRGNVAEKILLESNRYMQTTGRVVLANPFRYTTP